MYLNVDRQVYVIKTLAYRVRTDRHTAHGTRTDKSLKTEGPKILSYYIFYFKTVIIGGPIIFIHFTTTRLYIIIIFKKIIKFHFIIFIEILIGLLKDCKKIFPNLLNMFIINSLFVVKCYSNFVVSNNFIFLIVMLLHDMSYKFFFHHEIELFFFNAKSFEKFSKSQNF